MRLAPGAEIGEAEPVRTGGGSRAVLRLSDGSLVEMGERAELDGHRSRPRHHHPPRSRPDHRPGREAPYRAPARGLGRLHGQRHRHRLLGEQRPQGLARVRLRRLGAGGEHGGGAGARARRSVGDAARHGVGAAARGDRVERGRGPPPRALVRDEGPARAAAERSDARPALREPAPGPLAGGSRDLRLRPQLRAGPGRGPPPFPGASAGERRAARLVGPGRPRAPRRAGSRHRHREGPRVLRVPGRRDRAGRGGHGWTAAYRPRRPGRGPQARTARVPGRRAGPPARAR